MTPNLSGELREVLAGITDPGKLADFVAANIDLAVDAKAELLGTGDVAARLERLSVADRPGAAGPGGRLADLREGQVAPRRAPAGVRAARAAEDHPGGAGRGRARGGGRRAAQEARGGASPREEALKAGRRELERLGRMSPQSAEYQVAHTYVEVLAGLPWSVLTEDRLDIQHAREILDRDHFDLER